jgi:hypothetical protein
MTENFIVTGAECDICTLYRTEPRVIFDSIGLASAAGFTLSLAKRLRSLAVAAVGLGGLTLMPEGLVLGRPPVETDL